jgi:hypothetical protein
VSFRSAVVWLLGLLTATSAGVLVWASVKNFDLGIHASDTGTCGCTDHIVWVWLFLSLAVFLASGIGLLVLLFRPPKVNG